MIGMQGKDANASKVLISIVMPVYNAEKYLPAALKSIAEQSFDAYELILVNDASTDGSAALCDCAAKEDARLRVVHLEKNGGASAARNVGMDAACGEYLMFMDADDTMAQALLETVWAQPRADVTVWGAEDVYYTAGEQVTKRVAHCPKAGHHEGAAAVRRVLIALEKDTLLGYIWNKLYRREMLLESGVRFENRLVSEDIFFNLHQCAAWESMVTMDIVGLHYAHHAAHQSVTGRFVPDYFAQNKERVAAILALYDAWQMTSEEVLTILGNIYARYIFSALMRMFDKRAKKTAKARRAFLEECFYKDVLFARVMPHAAPEGRLASVMARALKKRRTGLCLAIAGVAVAVQTHLPGLLTRLRQSR